MGIWDPDFLTIKFQMVYFSNTWVIASVPTIQNMDINVLISNVLWKNGGRPQIKWSGFWIFDPIENLDHLQTNLFMTILNPDMLEFHIPTLQYLWSRSYN